MYMCFVYLGKWWHLDALWDDDSWRRECDTLCSVLLEISGTGHSCGCQFDTCHLPKHHCKPGTLLHDIGIYWWRMTCFSRIMHPSTLHRLFRNGLSIMMKKSSRCCPVLQIPQLSIWMSIYGMCWTNSNPWWLQHTGLEVSPVNVLVPDTTGHLKGSGRVHASAGRICLVARGWPTGILGSHVVIMFWLIWCTLSKKYTIKVVHTAHALYFKCSNSCKWKKIQKLYITMVVTKWYRYDDTVIQMISKWYSVGMTWECVNDCLFWMNCLFKWMFRSLALLEVLDLVCVLVESKEEWLQL